MITSKISSKLSNHDGIFVSNSFTANGNLIETLNTFHVLLIEVKFLIHFLTQQVTSVSLERDDHDSLYTSHNGSPLWGLELT